MRSMPAMSMGTRFSGTRLRAPLRTRAAWRMCRARPTSCSRAPTRAGAWCHSPWDPRALKATPGRRACQASVPGLPKRHWTRATPIARTAGCKSWSIRRLLTVARERRRQHTRAMARRGRRARLDQRDRQDRRGLQDRKVPRGHKDPKGRRASSTVMKPVEMFRIRLAILGTFTRYHQAAPQVIGQRAADAQ
jgi:hypothetical protein